VYAYRAGWNEALDVASISCDIENHSTSSDVEGQIVEWVDVYSDSPNELETVLVAWEPVRGMPTKMYRHFYGLATYEDEGFTLMSDSDYEDIKVIAWMRLPKEYGSE